MPVPSGTTESGLQPNFLSPSPFFVFLLSSGVCCGARKIKALFLPFFRLGVGAVCREFEIAQNFVLAGVARGIRMYFIARFGEKNRTFERKNGSQRASGKRPHWKAACLCSRAGECVYQALFPKRSIFLRISPRTAFFSNQSRTPNSPGPSCLSDLRRVFRLWEACQPFCGKSAFPRWRIHGNFKPFARREPVSWRSRGLLAFRRERFFAEAGRRLFCGICKKWERLRRRQAVSSPCARRGAAVARP